MSDTQQSDDRAKLNEAYIPLAMEEMGEVLMALGKCQRFGVQHYWVREGCMNFEAVAQEVGGLLEILDRLALPPELVVAGRARKVERLKVYGPEVWTPEVGDKLAEQEFGPMSDDRIKRVALAIQGAEAWSSFWGHEDALIFARAALAEADRCDPPRKPLAEGREHLTVDGEFQTDKFPLPPNVVSVKINARNRDVLLRLANNYRREPGKEEFVRDLDEALDNLSPMTEQGRIEAAIIKAWNQELSQETQVLAAAAISASKAHRAEAWLLVISREPTEAVEAAINEAILEEKSAGYIYRIGIEAAEKETTG